VTPATALERRPALAETEIKYDCSAVDWKKVSETLKRVGTAIIRHILDRLSHCNVILYASPGKEDFYRTLGMRKMKTGMALFLKADEKQKSGFTE
jgi:hypothetical protein